jgi:hypothetical protein
MYIVNLFYAPCITWSPVCLLGGERMALRAVIVSVCWLVEHVATLPLSPPSVGVCPALPAHPLFCAPHTPHSHLPLTGSRRNGA